MAVPTHLDSLAEHTLAVHETIEVPAGCQSEVIGGNIIISPPWPVRRAGISARLHAQFNRLLPTRLVATNKVTLDMAATGERYIPNLFVAPK